MRDFSCLVFPLVAGELCAAIIEDTSSATVNITPTDNTAYYYGTLTNLELVANTGKYQSWIRFSSGSPATVLSTSVDFKWAGGAAPIINANKTYEISIKDGYALWQEY